MLRILFALSFFLLAHQGQAAQLANLSYNSNVLEIEGIETQRGLGLNLEYNYLFNIANLVYLGPGGRYSGDKFAIDEHHGFTLSNFHLLFKVAFRAHQMIYPYVEFAHLPGITSAVTEHLSASEKDKHGEMSGVDVRAGFILRLNETWALNTNMVLASHHEAIFIPNPETTVKSEYGLKPFISYSIGLSVFSGTTDGGMIPRRESPIARRVRYRN